MCIQRHPAHRYSDLRRPNDEIVCFCYIFLVYSLFLPRFEKSLPRQFYHLISIGIIRFNITKTTNRFPQIRSKRKPEVPKAATVLAGLKHGVRKKLDIEPFHSATRTNFSAPKSLICGIPCILKSLCVSERVL